MAYDRRQNKNRNRSEQALSSELDRYLAKLQPRAMQTRKTLAPLLAAWKKIVSPPLGEHTTAVIEDKKDSRIIVIYLDGTTWLAEAGIQKEQYRNLLANELQREIADLRFRITRRT